MNIFPAVDLYDGLAVRLLRGDYEKMTVYSKDPLEKAREFKDAGAEYIHLVDLQGARDGVGVNFRAAARIAGESGLLAELGGGIRDEDAIKRALDAGFFRVILGTRALEDRKFLERAVEKYGDKIAVGVDVRDGFVAVRGWTEVSGTECFDFVRELCDMGVGTVICTDISKDGALRGTDRELFSSLQEKFSVNIVASGGVSGLEDVRALRDAGVYGAIIGKALYTGALELREAIEAAR